jgi:diguanylate cyclase (GGDEF)-like protein
VRENKFVLKLLQLVSVLVVSFLMLTIFGLVNAIQGTGRIINYTGLVRGGTQRLVKMEIAGYPRDDLIHNLDEILSGLDSGNGSLNLERLDDPTYLYKLSELEKTWATLKYDLDQLRQNPADTEAKQTVITVSEDYFLMADDLVDTVEKYQEEKSSRLAMAETLLSLVLVFLIISAVYQTMSELSLYRQNKELEKVAYLDKMTGIPGRRSCEEKIWAPMDQSKGPYCVAMFDLNNLKIINDQFGHAEGDRLIKTFAEIINRFANENLFVGRYGGDEFIMVIRGYDEKNILHILQEIQRQVDEYNDRNPNFMIQYAVGYECSGDSLQKMLERADEKMYENKKKQKEPS